MDKSTETYSFKSPRIQCFSLPSNIIYFITKNPRSPNVLQKLQQTCKYFFAKNSVVIVENGYFGRNKWPMFKSKRDINEIHQFYAKFSFIGKFEFYEWDCCGFTKGKES